MLRLRLMKKLRLKCRFRAAFRLCLPLRGEGGPLAVDEVETCTNSARNLNPILKNRFQGQITSHSQGFDPSNPKMLASLRIFRATSSVSSLCSLPPSPRRGRLDKAPPPPRKYRARARSIPSPKRKCGGGQREKTGISLSNQINQLCMKYIFPLSPIPRPSHLQVLAFYRIISSIIRARSKPSLAR